MQHEWAAEFVSECDSLDLRKKIDSLVCLLDHQGVNRNINMSLFGGMSFGNVHIYKYQNPVLNRSLRKIDHIRADHIDDFLICVPLQGGEHKVVQAGRCSIVEPGSFTFMATATPFESSSTPGPFDEYFLRVSGAELRHRVPEIDEYCARTLKIRSGAGEVMKTLLHLAVHSGKDLSNPYMRQFGTMVIDTITDVILSAPELEKFRMMMPQSTHGRVVRERAMEYIDTHLSNPELGIPDVAEHCRVSLRSLHASFAASGTTVSAYIREERLRRCREELQNPGMRRKLIIEIARRWGFNDAAHFTHIYKARFGKTPREERRSLTKL